MQIVTFTENLLSVLNRDVPPGERISHVELLRALREQSAHFNPDKASELPQFNPSVLRAKPGPGGGGPEADPFRGGFVLVAIMLGGTRSDIAYRVWDTWHLPAEGSVLSGWGDAFKPTFHHCDLTGAFLFGEALKTVLSDRDLPKLIQKLRITNNGEASIYHSGNKVSTFKHEYQNYMPLIRATELDGGLLRSIAGMVRPSEGRG
jgi:hypothetical protein